MAEKKEKLTLDPLQNLKDRLVAFVLKCRKRKSIIVPVSLIGLTTIAYLSYLGSGTEIFPKVDAGQMQVRLKMRPGTRIERTEDATKKVLSMIDSIAGKENIAITSAFVGLQPPTYAINPIYLYTSGPQEAVLKVNLTKESNLPLEQLKESIRHGVAKNMPELSLSFEPADLVDQVMSLGANNPIEIIIQGKNLSQSQEIAKKLKNILDKIDYLRDVQIGQPLEYPTLQINYDRIKMGQMDISVEKAGRSVLDATSSSRFIQPIYWLDNSSGNAYQVQVEYPQMHMNAVEKIEELPISNKDGKTVYLRDIASIKKINSIGEYDRINQQRYISLTANIYNKDLGTAVKDVNKNIKLLGSLPAGVKVYTRGQSEMLIQTIEELTIGLALAIFVVLLMLAAFFQSFKLAFTVLTVLPGALAGSILILYFTGNTINIQSFMGCIMALGVAIANAILLVSNAETIRREKFKYDMPAVTAASNRLRPILMTSLAMIVGMVPMAIGLSEGGKQTAPLAIAVIGGLVFSTISSLLIVPLVHDLLIGSKEQAGVSLFPEEK